MIRQILTIVCLTGLLVSCQNLQRPEVPSEITDIEGSGIGGNSDSFTINVLSDAEVVAGVADNAGAMDQRQFLADILFEGLQALDNDRLLTPIDNNAHARFQRVLAYDADNEIALQGLQDIVARYLELSLQASRRGLFKEAEALLENARFVDANHSGIPGVWLALQAEMNSGDLFFNLDDNEVTRRSERIQQQLVQIAQQAREHSANFLITAPNDDLARWMFNIMREAVDGYRLRGNIELASRSTVRLRLPRN